MLKNKEKDTELNDYMSILDKMLELEKEKKSSNPIKITVCVVGGIGSVIFIAILCYSILKSNFTLESILSTMLAFFSIFISIFFYFKADETSTKFYNTSYEFMKEVSVTLGKIEERFGEKLNSLNDKISHLDKISTEASQEIKDKSDDKENIINELMDKANLKEDERNKYRKELQEKDAEIEMLRRHRYQIEREADKLRRKFLEVKEDQRRIPMPSKSMLENLLKTRDTDMLSMEGVYNLQRLGLIDQDRKINTGAIINMLQDNY